jgi:hypothetical protein
MTSTGSIKRCGGVQHQNELTGTCVTQNNVTAPYSLLSALDDVGFIASTGIS